GGGEMKAITISRLYGSGGGEIGARVARRLNWHLIDHEIVARVARELGIPERTAKAQDEYAKGFITRVISQFVSTAPTAAAPVVQVIPDDQPDQERYQETLRHVVETAADTGRAVIIGRASQIYLANRRDVLHVFIEAPLQQRIAYVALRENLDAAGARERVQLKDGDRSRYFRTVLRKKPDDPMHYDLVINTGVLSLDWAVDLICRALEEKTKALSLSLEELGPARGMAPYPGQPADIRSPAHLTDTQPAS
ncbi:MAG TPA: cytidylate kinase-like family protein, partial [Ktedonobacteraceae bacterium]|nr:cytidylate kinase-like family protein [Ktedonobacteraceae bacterium]